MAVAKVEISHRTIIFTILFLIFLKFLVSISSVLLLLFIAVIAMSALSPIVDKLQRFRIPRGLGILLLYVLIWGVISFGIASLVPPLVDQTGSFIGILPTEVARLTEGRLDLSVFQPQLTSLPQQILKIALGLLNNVIGILTFMVIVYYLILERKNLHKYLTFMFGDGNREVAAEAFINQLELKLGSWVRGQLSLMLIIGIVTYAGLSFLGIPFAVPLAFLAGLLEIVPTVGPIVAGIPAVIIAFGLSPVTAFAAAALYFLIQQLENTLIVPRIMSKAVGLSPLVVIVALLIGIKIAGLAGAVLAIPATLLVEILVNDLYRVYYKKS